MKEYEQKLPVMVKGTVLDIDTTDHYPFTFGYISGDTLCIVQMEDETEAGRMLQAVRQVADFPRPLYAHEAKAQERWLGCSIEYDLAEVWKQVGEQFRPPWTRWCEHCGWVHKWDTAGNCLCGAPARDMLRELQPRPTAYAPRGLGPPGKDGGPAWWWREYLRTKQPYCLFVIALKAQADLLAGCCLVLWRSMGLPCLS